MTKTPRRPFWAYAALAAATVGAFFGTGLWNAFSDESVSVSAIVGLANTPPLVTSVDPNLDPITVAKSTSQAVSVTVSDPDSPSIAYTVTTSSGAVLPQNGTVPVVGGSATVGFTYYAPPSKARLVPVTLTFNDGTNTPTVRTVNMYVY